MNTNNRFLIKRSRLNKLIKYGFKNVWKEMLILYSVLYVSFLIIAIFIRCVTNAFIVSTVGTIIIGLLISFASFSFVACFISSIVLIYKSTTKNMFSDEGYLTFTLPISIDELLFSKLIVDLIYISGVGLISLIGLFTIYIIDFAKIQELNMILASALDMLFNGGFITILSYAIIYIFDVVLEILLLILAMAIVYTKYKGKNKSFLGIVTFVGIRYLFNSILNIITTFLSIGFGYDINGDLIFGIGYDSSNVVNYAFNFTSFIIYGIACVSMYLLTRYLLSKKLELLGRD